MGEKAYSDLYQIVRIVEEKKGQADLQEIGLLLNSQMRLRIVPKGERIFYMATMKNVYQAPVIQHFKKFVSDHTDLQL